MDKLHDKARRAIESGEEKFRDAAEYLAEAQKLGASQRQNAKAIGMSPAWVNALLKWRRSGYRDRCPFPRSNRRVQPAGCSLRAEHRKRCARLELFGFLTHLRNVIMSIRPHDCQAAQAVVR